MPNFCMKSSEKLSLTESKQSHFYQVTNEKGQKNSIIFISKSNGKYEIESFNDQGSKHGLYTIISSKNDDKGFVKFTLGISEKVEHYIQYTQYYSGMWADRFSSWNCIAMYLDVPFDSISAIEDLMMLIDVESYNKFNEHRELAGGYEYITSSIATA